MGIVTKVALGVIAVVGAGKLIQHGDRALKPALPRDMPAQSSFIQTGYNLQRNEAVGQWVACGQDTAQNANFCRVSDAKGVIVYQGDYLPLSQPHALPMDALKVAQSGSNGKMWVTGPQEQGPVPVFTLQGGQILVPAGDREAFQDRWNRHPEELEAIQSGE